MGAARARYPTDLTDTEWQVLAPLIPPAKPGGTSGQTRAPRDRRCIGILVACRVCVAASATRSAALANGVSLLASMAD